MRRQTRGSTMLPPLARRPLREFWEKHPDARQVIAVLVRRRETSRLEIAAED